MTITISNVAFVDLPMDYNKGASVRRRTVYVTGTCTATTDAFNIPDYEPNMASLDYISPIVSPQAQYTISGGGTVTATSNVAGTSFSNGGSVTPGTAANFTVWGIITLK